LEIALEAGGPAGCQTSFSLDPALFSLLNEAARLGRHAPFIRQIVSASGEMTASPQDIPMDARARLPGQAPGLIENLTTREVEVLQRAAAGASNQAIAAELFITIGTVKSHLNHILGKLNARNRTEAAAIARRLGLI